MLKTIIQPSRWMVNFLLLLHLRLSKPQRVHLLRLSEALVVCQEPHKTLAALHRQWVEAPDVSAAADFLRESPWAQHEVRAAVARFMLRDLIEQAQAEGAARVVYISLDDSKADKDEATTKLEAVDWTHDHHKSTKRRPVYVKAASHVSVRVEIGRHSIPFTFRLYLREKTVRRINRGRSKSERLRFRSKYRLAREMLEELKALLRVELPKGYKIYVLFDSWYASARLIKYVRRQGWHVMCTLKSNRLLDGIQLSQHHKRLKHQPYIRVRAADGKTYLVRQLQGHLREISFEVRVLISKRHPRDKHPKYLMTTDLSLSVPKVLKGFAKRWSIEVEYWTIKEQLGLADFRMWSYQAIERWYTLVYFVLAFLSWRSRQSGHSLSQVLHQHRSAHARAVLVSACEAVRETGDLDGVLPRYIGQAA